VPLDWVRSARNSRNGGSPGLEDPAGVACANSSGGQVPDDNRAGANYAKFADVHPWPNKHIGANPRVRSYVDGLHDQGHRPYVVVVGTRAEVRVLAQIGAPLERDPSKVVEHDPWSDHRMGGQSKFGGKNHARGREYDHLPGSRYFRAKKLQQARSKAMPGTGAPPEKRCLDSGPAKSLDDLACRVGGRTALTKEGFLIRHDWIIGVIRVRGPTKARNHAKCSQTLWESRISPPIAGPFGPVFLSRGSR